MSENEPGDGPYTPNMELVTWKGGGGVDNELWQQQPANETVYMLQAIAFDATKAVIAPLQPVYGADLGINNNSEGAIEAPLSANIRGGVV